MPAAGFDEAWLLRLVGSAERGSEHPLAAAIVTGARDRGADLVDATEFDSVTGQGVRATVDGRRLLVGNARILAEAGIALGSLERIAAELGGGGKTPMYFSVDEQAAGLIAVADTIKPDSVAAIGLSGVGRVVRFLSGAGPRATAGAPRAPRRASTQG